MSRTPYPSSLTDAQWQLIAPLAPPPQPGGRPAKYTRRAIVDGIQYVARTGCAWRSMPTDLLTYRICFHYFRRWQRDGTWDRIHAALREQVRRAAGKRRRPTTGISTARRSRRPSRAAPEVSTEGKRVSGRKRHVVVDTLGLVWGVCITPASVQDWDGGREAMLRAKSAAPRVVRVFADSAYRTCSVWAAWFARVVLWVVPKPVGPGLTARRKRWVVERTFGWLGRWRRLAKDYERTCESSEAFVTVARSASRPAGCGPTPNSGGGYRGRCRPNPLRPVRRRLRFVLGTRGSVRCRGRVEQAAGGGRGRRVRRARCRGRTVHALPIRP